MNCQDIVRILNEGKIGTLSAAEREEGEAHAVSCRQCARRWVAQTRLADLPIPPMPCELATQMQALVAARSRGNVLRFVSRRKMVLVGGFVALAAASMVLMKIANAPAPQQGNTAAERALPPVEPAIPLPMLTGSSTPAAEPTVSAALHEPPAADSASTLPLFPPQHAYEQAFATRLKMALEKFVELHPEVTQALAAGNLYDASIVLRADGKVVDHAIRTLAREELHWSRYDPTNGLPNDGGEPFTDYVPKGTPLADGRALGADLSLRNVLVRNTYDTARSSLRVEQIVRAQRAELMLPSTGMAASHVTILLSAAGAIQREVVAYVDRDALQEQEDWNAIKRAEAMAGLLGVSKNEIGLMGSVPVFDNETKRGVMVDYAWQRLPGESAPQYRQDGWDRYGQEGLDTATALAVVERVMPDAFMGDDMERALGIPVILLTEKGEFIRTARNKSSDPRDAVPGIPIASFRMLVLKNGKGATSAVYFMWQGSPGLPPRAQTASDR